MQPLHLMKRLARAIAERYQRQIAKEDQNRVLAEFAALDRDSGTAAARHPRHTAGASRDPNRHTDPLEQIWNLPARRHGRPRRSNA